jgi:DNA polymerase (family 10)
MDRQEISALLDEIGVLLELQGENQFKVRAYRNASRVIESTDADIQEMVRAHTLIELPGIGDAIAEKIAELVTTGKLGYYDALKEMTPPGLLEMLAIPSLGPKKIRALSQQLSIRTIADLEKACDDNKLTALDGFGEKTQQKILAGIAYIKKNKDLHRIDTAMRDAARLLEALKKSPHIADLALAGSIRRRKELIKDIDAVATSDQPAAVMKFFTALPLVGEIIAHGDTKSSVRLVSGINADLRIVSAGEFPFALQHLTGSKEHNIALRSRAKQMGLTMNEYGLFKGAAKIPCANEEEIYAALKLSYIPPELREDRGEITAAEKHALPILLEPRDITGTFHAHTTMSDGAAALDHMIMGAQEKGLQYIGIADHSQTAYYAGGLKEKNIREQHACIDMLNNSLKNIHIFKGIESDILPDGSLDYPDKVLARFDFVIASIHSRFNLPEKDMTNRIIRAMKNKHCTMLGHMTGRLLLTREPYQVNARDIITAAADYGVIIELNSNPYRLDIDWRELRFAKEKGVLISINPDAHRVEDLDFIGYGVSVARKGWLTKEDVFNTRNVAEITKYFGDRKK